MISRMSFIFLLLLVVFTQENSWARSSIRMNMILDHPPRSDPSPHSLTKKRLSRACFLPCEKLIKEDVVLKTLLPSVNLRVDAPWNEILRKARPDEHALYVGMFSGDAHFAFLWLLDRVMLDGHGKIRALDVAVEHLDYPLEAHWARHLYKSHIDRAWKKGELHLWLESLRRLVRDIEEGGMFETRLPGHTGGA